MINKKDISNIASLIKPDIIEIRNHLHKFPELSNNEFETSKFIAKILQKEGINNIYNIANTGIIGFIEGENPEKQIIAIRAELDALPINEETNKSYSSINKGIMHACGHDVHIACLIGSAIILNKLRQFIKGRIMLVFQPSEETFPGGAVEIIKNKIFNDNLPDKMFALHVLPTLEVGKLGFKGGEYMASTDEIHLQVIGKGGHGATPEQNIDTVTIAANILIALQQVVSRKIPPTIPAVLSFGHFIADGQTNIIPDKAIIKGTFRIIDDNWRYNTHKIIKQIATSTAEAFGAKCIVDIRKGYPCLANDLQTTEEAKKLAIEFLGKDNIVDLSQRLTADDFAYFAQKIPSCFFRLGTMNYDKGIIHNLHSSNFDIDTDAIAIGASTMAWIVANNLL